MQMHQVGEVTQVIGALNANNKLAEGWTLLAVVSGKVVGTENSSVVYVLGKQAKSKGLNISPDVLTPRD